MSTGKKALLGILSFGVVVLFGIWIVYYVRWIMDFLPDAISYEANPDLFVSDISGRMNIRGLIMTSVALLFPASLISLGLLIYYIIQVVNSRMIDTGERVVWIITLILFCPLTFPIYWLMRVRNLPPNGMDLQAPPSVPQGPTYGY